jgi:hypothetical protein
MKKAETLGYRGDREQFSKLERRIKNESEEVVNQLVYYKVFKDVKLLLDSKKSVTSETY